MSDHGITVPTLARESGYSRRHLRQLGLGEIEPTRKCMVQVVKACRRILRHDVEIRELFDLGDGDALDANAYQWMRGARWLERLREAVRATGRLQSEIAYKAGIPEETLSRIMTGQSRNPSMDTVVTIARAIGVTVGWLLEERGYSLSVAQIQRLREASTIIDEVTGGGA